MKKNFMHISICSWCRFDIDADRMYEGDMEV